jgi:hypothetical protein
VGVSVPSELRSPREGKPHQRELKQEYPGKGCHILSCMHAPLCAALQFLPIHCTHFNSSQPINNFRRIVLLSAFHTYSCCDILYHNEVISPSHPHLLFFLQLSQRISRISFCCAYPYFSIVSSIKEQAMP